MDTLSHALYGGLVTRRFSKNKQTFVLSFIFGALPDLMLATLSPIRAVKIFFTPGSSLPEYYIYYYRILHSFFTALLIYLCFRLFNKKYTYLAIPYFFHILLDIPTHSGHFATQFLYPFSTFAIQGYTYTRHLWLWITNFFVLIALYLWCYHKSRYAPQSSSSPQSSRP